MRACQGARRNRRRSWVGAHVDDADEPGLPPRARRGCGAAVALDSPSVALGHAATHEPPLGSWLRDGGQRISPLRDGAGAGSAHARAEHRGWRGRRALVLHEPCRPGRSAICGHSRSWRSAQARPAGAARRSGHSAPVRGLVSRLRGAHRMPPDRNGARSCSSHCGGERVDVVGAPVPLPVDEEAGCAGHTARVCAQARTQLSPATSSRRVGTATDARIMSSAYTCAARSSRSSAAP